MSSSSSDSRFPHYIFGYGSLICPHSRALTAPTLSGRSAVPVRVHGWERIWSLPFRGITFLGIRCSHTAETVGVLVPVHDDELAQFDRRELGYDRISIETQRVQELHFSDFPKTSASSLSLSSSSPPSIDPTASIWVYVQQHFYPISQEAPICQSYVDILLRGCLTISQDFTKDFLLTTRGWHAHDFDSHPKEEDQQQHQQKQQNEKQKDAEEETTKEGSSSESVHWIDDRQDPRYVRADKEYSQANATHLDRMLELHRPEWKHRKRASATSCN